MDIDDLRNEQDMELQEQMWDTDCDLSSPIWDLKVLAEFERECILGLTESKDFQVGDLISSNTTIYKIIESDYPPSGNVKVVATCKKHLQVGEITGVDLAYPSLYLWERPETGTSSSEVSFDREVVEAEYDYDILDKGRGLV